jgi:hypothetical protein
VSGVNVLKLQTERKLFDIGAISTDEFWAYMVSFCRQNPTRDISHAADDVVAVAIKELHAVKDRLILIEPDPDFPLAPAH